MNVKVDGENIGWQIACVPRMNGNIDGVVCSGYMCWKAIVFSTIGRFSTKDHAEIYVQGTRYTRGTKRLFTYIDAVKILIKKTV